MKDLTKEQKYDLACITLASIQIQSAIHTLDNVSGMGNDFKFKKKKDWNDFIDYVKRWANKEGADDKLKQYHMYFDKSTAIKLSKELRKQIALIE